MREIIKNIYWFSMVLMANLLVTAFINLVYDKDLGVDDVYFWVVCFLNAIILKPISSIIIKNQ